MTPDEVAILAKNAGFTSCDSLAKIVAIAGAESDYVVGCTCDNINGKGTDWGLWQANDLVQNACSPFDCYINSSGAKVCPQCKPSDRSGCNDFTRSIKLPPSVLRQQGAALYAYREFLCFKGDFNGPWGATYQNGQGQKFNQLLPAAKDAAVRAGCCANGSCPPSPSSKAVILQLESITSGDPNDKTGSQGIGTQQYVASATPLRYVILFSNLETATAPAQDIVITDQLDLKTIDLTTFTLGPIAFGTQLLLPQSGTNTYTTISDLRPAANLLVKVTAQLNLSTGLITWIFKSLDPSTSQPPSDPTAGFLPPGGQGSVFFTAMPKQILPTGTQIQNQATIVFDANPPMTTQTWLNTLDNTPPTSVVTALPATQNSPNFTIQWSGNDVGSGVQDFTIYSSDNGGPFVPVLANTSAASMIFAGQPGHIYGFYSIARDFVGNLEPQKSAPDATTQVALDTTPPVTAAGILPIPNANGWNNANVTITLTSTDDEPNGTGIKQITYSATGSQNIGSTVVGGASASLTISTEGITTITFFGTDNAGNIEIPKTIAIKLDKTPPTIISSQAPVPNANGWNNTNVSVSFTCTDNLSGLAPGSPPTATLITAEGANQSATGTCTDLAGNLATVIVQGINIDKTPPIASCNASPDVLWPPNHKLVPINVSVTVSDTLSGPAGFTLNSVTSNEPDSGQGDIQGFVIGTASTNGQLRAERLGSGNGRTYTLVYTGVDRAGNSAICNTSVSVPHDQGH